VRKVINPSANNHEIYIEFFSLYKELNKGMSVNYQEHKNLRTLVESTRKETVQNL
jgi:hypothetical protein